MKLPIKKIVVVTMGIIVSIPLVFVAALVAHWKIKVLSMPEPYKSAVEQSCSPFGGCGCLEQAEQFITDNTPIPNPECPEGYAPLYPMCEGLAYCAKKTNIKSSVGPLNE